MATDGTPRPLAENRRALYCFLGALLVGEIVTTFETTMVHAAMGTFVETFGGTVRASWIITSFMLIAASSAAIGGRLGDLYGRSRVLVYVLGISVLGSFISATAPSYELVIVGRGMQGVAGACLPLMFGLLREHMPRDRVMLGIGLIATTALLAGGAGVFLGGVLIDHFSWRTMFYISGSVGILAVILAIVFVPGSSGGKRNGPIDMLGGALFVPAVAFTLYGISQTRNWGWSDPWTLGFIATGLVILSVWALHELRHRDPLIDIRLLSRRQVLVANLCMILTAFSAMQAPMVLSLLLQQPVSTGVGLGLSGTVAGAVIGIGMMVAVFSGPLSGFIADHHSGRRSMIIGSAAMTVGWIGMLIEHQTLWFIACMLFVLEVGKGMVFATVPMLLVESVPAERTSEANGLTAVLRQAFIGIGASVIALALTTSTIGHGGDTAGMHGVSGGYPTASAYQLSIGIIAVMSVLCLVFSLMLPGSHRRKDAAAGQGAPLAPERS